MKVSYKRSAYRRWKKKGMIEEDSDGNKFLLKSGEKIKLTFEEDKVFLEDKIQEETVETKRTPYRSTPMNSFFAKKSGVIQID